MVVKVNRPKYKKKGKDMLKHDDRYDYEVNIGDSLYDLSEPIWDIAIDIINKNIKNGNGGCLTASLTLLIVPVFLVFLLL